MVKTKQLSMEDFDVIKPLSREEKNKDIESISIDTVDYGDFTKEELIGIIESKDQAYRNMEIRLEDIEKKSDMTIKNAIEEYEKRIKDLSKVLGYYERKLSLVKSIIELETGGEK